MGNIKVFKRDALKAIEAIRSGMSLVEYCAHAGYSPSAIINAIKRNGLETEYQEAQRARQQHYLELAERTLRQRLEEGDWEAAKWVLSHSPLSPWRGDIVAQAVQLIQVKFTGGDDAGG